MSKQKVSTNCYKGKVIKNPQRIINLALERKSVYYRNWDVKPASIYLSMQFRIIMDLIQRKELFEVKK